MAPLLELNPQDGQQLIQINGLRHVVGGASFHALLAITFHGLGGDGDQGKGPKPLIAPNLPHGLVPVHLGHHDVDQHGVDVRIGPEKLDPVTSILREKNLQSVLLVRRQHP